MMLISIYKITLWLKCTIVNYVSITNMKVMPECDRYEIFQKLIPIPRI